MSELDFLKKRYLKHSVFNQLKDFTDFYFAISENSSRKGTPSIGVWWNMNSVFFESMKDTLDSIKILLEKCRIGDAYALLRKYEDITLYQTYCDLNIKEKHSIDNLIVNEIKDVLFGKTESPRIKTIDRYIHNTELLKPMAKFFNNDKRLSEIRGRCNDYTHYNQYKNILLNNDEIGVKVILNEFDQLKSDLSYLFIRHFSYTLFLNGEYITDEDYFVCLDAGICEIGKDEPWVSLVIQTVFDTYIKPERPDIAKVIKEKLGGDLE